MEKRNQVQLMRDAIKMKLSEEINNKLVNFKQREKYRTQATLNDRV